MNYELARIILPTPEWKDYTDLFIRSNTELKVAINGCYTDAKLYEFNTWMNLFAAKKYYKYCDLGELYLRLHVKGSYHLQIIGSNRDHVFNRLDTILVDTYISSETTEICIPDTKNYDGVYFIVYEIKDNPIEIISAAWTTDKAPVRNSRLAIVTCTFKREQYINKTIAAYEQFISDNPLLKERIKLFVVDNGKTLDLERSNDITQIYHNKNAGGAGGFTRGLMEVCCLNEGVEQNNPYTRVLFMDDDVVVIPETFYRTLVLSDYLREEWKESFINGSMANLEHKNILYEILAIQDKLFTTKDYTDLNMFNYDSVLLSNEHSDDLFINANAKVHSAWWYCCFSISKDTKDNLPLPLFYRGDDVEWSWRNYGKHHISLNGINVWHPAFPWRVGLMADMYYLVRNMFIANILHTKGLRDEFDNYLIELFDYRLKIYDYIAIEILLATMDDISRGSASLREEPESQMRRIKKIEEKLQYFDANKNELEQAKHYYPGAGSKRKLVSKLTKWGRYCPDFIFTKNSMALEWYPPVENFMLRKEVKVYNLYSRKYRIQKFDREKVFMYKKRFHECLHKIHTHYENLEKDYKDSYKELTSFSFWKKYLDLT